MTDTNFKQLLMISLKPVFKEVKRKHLLWRLENMQRHLADIASMQKELRAQEKAYHEYQVYLNSRLNNLN